MWWIPDAAACDPRPPAHLVESARRSESAFLEADPERALASVRAVRANLPCVTAPLTPVEVAALDRMFAYEAFMQRDLTRAELWVAAALRLDPGTPLPLPDRHPLRAAVTPVDPVLAPVRGVPWVDGTRAKQAPTALPTVLQSGDPLVTVIRTPWDAAPQPAPAPEGPDGRLAVLGGAVVHAREGRVSGLGGVSVRGDLGLTSWLAGQVSLGAGLTRVEEGLYLLPSGSVGARVGLRGPWASAGMMAVVDAGGPAVGPAGAVGFDGERVTGELRVGWAGAAVASAGVGWRFW